MIRETFKCAKQLEMHLYFGGKFPRIPTLLLFLVGQFVLTMLVPELIPGHSETKDFVVDGWIIAVNAVLIIMVVSFLLRITWNTYVLDREERKQFRTDMLLSMGDMESVCKMMLPDMLVIKIPGEKLSDFVARVNAARNNASLSYWVIVLVPNQPFGFVYTSINGEGFQIDRRQLPWEESTPEEERILHHEYDFAIETQEKFERFVGAFAYHAKRWIAEYKPVYAMNQNPEKAFEVILNQAK